MTMSLNDENVPNCVCFNAVPCRLQQEQGGTVLAAEAEGASIAFPVFIKANSIDQAGAKTRSLCLEMCSDSNTRTVVQLSGGLYRLSVGLY